MKPSEQDKLYQQFKQEEMPVFKWIGLIQGIGFGLMIIGAILSIWIDWILIIKIEATLFITAVVLAIIYHHLDKLTRKQFDEVFNDEL